MPGTLGAVVNTTGGSIHGGGTTRTLGPGYSRQTALNTSGAIDNRDIYPGNRFLPQGCELGV